jgi:acyl carrier protein
MTSAEALGHWDAALSSGHGVVVAARIDRRGLQAQFAAMGTVPSILDGLIRTPAASAVVDQQHAVQLAERLAGLSDDERRRLLSELVRAQVAAVLGHRGPDAVDPESSFLDLGFDSLTAVEMRNRIAHATGVTLPATVAFDRPTPAALADHLASELALPDAAPTLEWAVDRFASELDVLSSTPEERRRAVARLRRLVIDIEDGAGADTADPDDDIRSATDAELFELLDGELG